MSSLSIRDAAIIIIAVAIVCTLIGFFCYKLDSLPCLQEKRKEARQRKLHAMASPVSTMSPVPMPRRTHAEAESKPETSKTNDPPPEVVRAREIQLFKQGKAFTPRTSRLSKGPTGLKSNRSFGGSQFTKTYSQNNLSLYGMNLQSPNSAGVSPGQPPVLRDNRQNLALRSVASRARLTEGVVDYENNPIHRVRSKNHMGQSSVNLRDTM